MTSKETIIGMKILVGLTYMNDNETVESETAIHGIITKVNESTITFEKSDGTGSFSIPFEDDLESSDPDAIYTLASGEEVTGVHLTSRWTIWPPGSPTAKRTTFTVVDGGHKTHDT